MLGIWYYVTFGVSALLCFVGIGLAIIGCIAEGRSDRKARWTYVHGFTAQVIDESQSRHCIRDYAVMFIVGTCLWTAGWKVFFPVMLREPETRPLGIVIVSMTGLLILTFGYEVLMWCMHRARVRRSQLR
jgi:hypothetical protein